ncbi:MAG TPA: pyruvate kinase [Fimbriimonadaceae bacterium]|nr:pyruvate kinase [Fimbriimonadaceae bacterium]
MRRRTKIVCTLGPAVDSPEQIRALVDAGMNVARLNCSHGDWETKRRWIRWVRDCCTDVAPIAILADLQGPKFRIGVLAGDVLDLKPGQAVTLGEGDVDLPIHQEEILKAITSGCRLLLGDGNVELRVTEQEGFRFEARVVSGGPVKSRQGVTLVGRVFEVSAITDKDREDIEEALKAEVDFIALSYVKRAKDILDLREIVDRIDPKVRLCAKIETRSGFLDIENILDAVDLVMVARGDLGLQMDIEDVPMVQKKIIEKCTQYGKPVITATQMLESMMTNPRPTRAEATDIANAILDGTDAVMLSGETASGQYPIECVKTMARIAEKAEKLFDRGRIESVFRRQVADGITHTEAVAHSVAELAGLIRPAAIITNTTSGQTARIVSKFRPHAPILCATYDPRTQAQMAVVWGVDAVHVPRPSTTEESVGNAVDAFLRHKKLKPGDHVIVTAGVPAGVPGNTNMILTHRVD